MAVALSFAPGLASPLHGPRPAHTAATHQQRASTRAWPLAGAPRGRRRGRAAGVPAACAERGPPTTPPPDLPVADGPLAASAPRVVAVPHLSDYVDSVALYDSPVRRRAHHFVDGELILTETVVTPAHKPCQEGYLRSGPRKKLFHRNNARAAIVTCGGLAPGLNTIIREIVMSLQKDYGITTVFGVEYGFRGFYSSNWRRLTTEDVEHIHKEGGTILGSSRDGFDLTKIVDAIETRGLSMVFIAGGDGTAMGAQKIFEECCKRRLKISICHVPKTVDRDIPLLDNTFGFDTAVEEAQRAINAAAIEASSYPDCISIVKLMGRNSGFIAAYSTLASREVDCCLIPEVQFALHGPGGLLEYIEKIMDAQGQCVVVIAEGAGSEHLGDNDDIGLLIFKEVKKFFKAKGRDISGKYLDPTYQVRALAPIASDNILCTLLAHAAVHSAVAGYTGFCAGPVNGHNVMLPLQKIAGKQARLDPEGRMWQRILSSTQQPEWMAPTISAKLPVESTNGVAATVLKASS